MTPQCYNGIVINLRAEVRFVVEISSEESAVLVSGDDALALDADTARTTGDVASHVRRARVGPDSQIRLRVVTRLQSSSCYS